MTCTTFTKVSRITCSTLPKASMRIAAGRIRQGGEDTQYEEHSQNQLVNSSKTWQLVRDANQTQTKEEMS
jgi:hypothetical protein